MLDKNIEKICTDLVSLSMYRDGKLIHCVNCHGYDGKHLGNCSTETAIKWLDEYKKL